MLACSIGKTDVISAPEDDMVEAKINQAGVEKQYRIAGKKAKSHGAS